MTARLPGSFASKSQNRYRGPPMVYHGIADIFEPLRCIAPTSTMALFMLPLQRGYVSIITTQSTDPSADESVTAGSRRRGREYHGVHRLAVSWNRKAREDVDDVPDEVVDDAENTEAVEIIEIDVSEEISPAHRSLESKRREWLRQRVGVSFSDHHRAHASNEDSFEELVGAAK